MKLVFATNNKHKLEEVRSGLGAHVELLSLADIGCDEEIEETESTLEGNAWIKSDHVKKNYGFDCFSDDTGLEVSMLDGAPGVYSARYAGEDPTYAENVDKLLREMGDSPDRKAKFRTVVSLNLGGKQYFFEGVCTGMITTEPRGKKGFGYDPIFQPDGFDKTFAEMNMEEKGRISHRGKAIQKLLQFLNGLDQNKVG